MESLPAALVVAAHAAFQIGDVQHMAQQLPMPGLRQRPADIGAEAEIDFCQIIHRVPRARQPAQQQKPRSRAQHAAEIAQEISKSGQRKFLRRHVRKIHRPQPLQMPERGIDLIDLIPR